MTAQRVAAYISRTIVLPGYVSWTGKVRKSSRCRSVAAAALHRTLRNTWTSIDWDDHFAEQMRDAEVLVTLDLPTQDLASVAPQLKWIHIIGAGVEHLCPMD